MGATFYRKGRGAKSWVVVVRWRGERHHKLVASKQDAEDLVRRVHKQELAGINVVETIRQARAQAESAPVVEAVTFPTLRADQLGHATIAQTADTYGHAQPDRHETAVDRLDEYPTS